MLSIIRNKCRRNMGTTHLQASWRTAHQEPQLVRIPLPRRGAFVAIFFRFLSHTFGCGSMRSSSKKMSYSSYVARRSCFHDNYGFEKFLLTIFSHFPLTKKLTALNFHGFILHEFTSIDKEYSLRQIESDLRCVTLSAQNLSQSSAYHSDCNVFILYLFFGRCLWVFVFRVFFSM